LNIDNRRLNNGDWRLNIDNRRLNSGDRRLIIVDWQYSIVDRQLQIVNCQFIFSTLNIFKKSFMSIFISGDKNNHFF